jgi:hypothetical protein
VLVGHARDRSLEFPPVVGQGKVGVKALSMALVLSIFIVFTDRIVV